MSFLPPIEDPLALHLDRLARFPNTDPCGKFNLVHETVLRFENDRRYLNDMRYVRLWLEYASFFVDPQWVYAHMMSKAIGVYIGAVYEQMAEYYIAQKRWKDADSILCKGIDSQAEPAARLQHKLHQVRHRVFQEEQAVKDAAELAKKVPKRILHLLDWIDNRLSYEGRRAMVKECFVYTHEEASFEEIRAKRWKKRTYSNPQRRVSSPPPSQRQQLPQHLQEQKDKQIDNQATTTTPHTNASVDVDEHNASLPSIETAIRPILEHNDPISRQVVVDIPHETALEERILGKLQPPLATYSGFYNLLHISHRPRVTNRKIELCSQAFTVIRKLGQGGMASVYELMMDMDSSRYAAKIESPPHPWEFYINRQVNDRAPHISLKVHAFYMYGNASILLMDVASKGTLLDALNAYRSAHKVAGMPEPLVLSLARQLVTALGDLHKADIIHGDLKIDNVVMVDEEEGGGQRIGLIDFGRAVDLRMLPNNSRLNPRWPIGSSDPPMPPPWNPWLIDKWGLAGILHMLLFGKAMKTVAHHPSPATQQRQQPQQKRWCIQERLRRYWRQELWRTVFDELLNNSQQGLDAAATALSVQPAKTSDGVG
ncbi:kinase-like domain-containing protein, partial [Dichotomocladium elegans]